jgi:hypothetical protein
MREPNLINSGLSRRITVEGKEFRIEIYRLEHTGWTLEAVDEEGASIVWDGEFETDQAALDEVLRSIADEGLGAFRESPNVIPFPKT